jgi:hypothetical protein
MEKTTRTFLFMLLKSYKLVFSGVIHYTLTKNTQYTVYFNPFHFYTYFFQKLTKTMKTNLLLSLKFTTLRSILGSFNLISFTTNNSKLLNGPIYLRSVRYSSIFFNKNKLNSLLYFTLHNLLTNYSNYLNSFETNLTSLVVPVNFYFFMFDYVF